MNTPAFTTGSRMYGKPRLDSDLDVVMLVDPYTMVMLGAMSDPNPNAPDYYNTMSMSLRFGKLNLIATTSPAEYEAWRKATDACIEAAKLQETQFEFGAITREEAIAIHKDHRKPAEVVNA